MTSTYAAMVTRQREALTPNRLQLEHRVKSWPELFEATLSGVKTHEMRRSADRDFRVGDLLRLQEFHPGTERYTGRELVMEITYITSAEFPCALSGDGLDPGYSILSVRKAIAGT